MGVDKNEILKFAFENGMIDLNTIQMQIEMKARKEYLEMHKYKIWKGSDGNWHTYLPDAKKGRVPKRRSTKSEIEEVVINYWKDLEENPTVEEMFYNWINDKLSYGEIGRSTYDRYIVDFNKYFVSIKNRKIKYIDEDDLEDFVKKSIHEYQMTSKCFSNFRTLIYGIFKRAKKRKCINFSVTELMKDMEVSRKSFKKVIKVATDQIYTSEEKPLMETYLENNPDIINLGLLLVFKTGLRVGELSSIKREEVQDYTIPINRTETRYKDEYGNTKYEVKDFPKSEAGVRFAIVPEKYKWIIDKILELNPNGEYLFEKDGKRVKTYSFRTRINYICTDKLNIKAKSPHKVRKTFGTILMDSNVKESTILEVMGHAEIDVTKNHYYFDRTNIEDKRKELGLVAEL